MNFQSHNVTLLIVSGYMTQADFVCLGTFAVVSDRL